MYSQHLQTCIQQIGNYANVDPANINLLNESMACFVSTLGRVMGANTEPVGDVLNLSVRLLLISDGLARLDTTLELEGVHYLVGLGFEQTGELLARLLEDSMVTESDPLSSDLWYTLTLAILHYLSSGYRVQALSVLRKLRNIANRNNSENIERYRSFAAALMRLYSGRISNDSTRNVNEWDLLMLGSLESTSYQQLQIQRLAQKIRQRRDKVLVDLGQGNEASWLSIRSVSSEAADFWAMYLNRLEERGITTFTNEQVGDGFDVWLQPNNDLLVILPTGSGKTIIGELRTALTLARNQQVIWLLPTRALVRQTARNLGEAFELLGVDVEELPTTEDFIPMFDEEFEQFRHIAVTTPEKLESLLRSNPGVVDNVGLIVVDEAQILYDQNRGTTAEFVLQQIRYLIPLCNIIFMSAFDELKESLASFLSKLGRQPVQLTSDIRPTRRMYGIISNDYDTLSKKQYPAILLYPPGPQTDVGSTVNPFRFVFNQDRPLPNKSIKAIDTAGRIVAKAATSRLRTVFFVQKVGTTETQACTLIRQLKQKLILPSADLARLHIELGRVSIIEETSKKGVAPHHAGLTPLEQTLVENWVLDGIVSTVVATSTLAQGINLPFDFSIITYTTRWDEKFKRNSEVPLSEIRNMLGRAGRAGYVSDGVGLISIKRERGTTNKVLDSSRSYFFRSQSASTEFLGLSRLAMKALNANVGNIEWLSELGGLTFSEAQRLVHFVFAVTYRSENVDEDITARIQRFPSIQQLSESEMQKVVKIIGELSENITLTLEIADDLALSESIQRTGMPIEILSNFLSSLRVENILSITAMTELDQILWTDQIIYEALVSCSSREWYRDIFKNNIPLDKVFAVIKLWRSGFPIIELEKLWESVDFNPHTRIEEPFIPQKKTRIDLGRFLNHNLSLIAQFWGAFAVCYEVLFNPSPKEPLKLLLQRLPACTREGVKKQEELEWLYAIGGVDRVLAHSLARIWETKGYGQKSGQYIRNQVKFWRKGHQSIPIIIDGQDRQALQSALGLKG